VLNQTYQDFEVVILDDCSTDNSKEIIEQYRNHPKVSQIVYNTNNSGSTFKQWDKGINLAQGEYIWIAESDDWCEPTLLETLTPKLELDKNIVLGYVQSYYMVDNEAKWTSKKDYSEKQLDTKIEGNLFIKHHSLYVNAIINASMAIFRKSAFYKIDNEYTKFKFCGDWLFWGLIASRGDVFISGKILNYFRNHSNDVSTKSYKTGLNYLEEIDVLKQFYTRKYIDIFEFKWVLLAKYKNFANDKSFLPIDRVHEIQEKFETYIKSEIYFPKIFKFKRKLNSLIKKCKKIIK